MRIHFNFVNILATPSEKYLIVIDNNKLRSFSELKKFIIQKFDLENFFIHENICFTLNGSKILETELIQDYLKDNDILNVEKNDVSTLKKRKRQDNENDCGFCSFIENVFYLKNNFSGQSSSFKKLHVEPTHETEPHKSDYFIKEKEILTKFDDNILEEKKITLKKSSIKERSESEKEEIPIEKKKKQKIIKKTIIQPDSPLPVEVVIPKKKVEKPKIIEKPIVPTDSSESEASLSSSPKKIIPSTAKVISKTVPKTIPPKKENEIVKKTAQNNSLKLNILTPEEEFQIKKATWKSLPYNNSKKPEKKNESKDFSSFNKKFTMEAEKTQTTQKSTHSEYFEPKEDSSFNKKPNNEVENNKVAQNVADSEDLVKPTDLLSEEKVCEEKFFEEKKFVNLPLSKLRENNFLKVGNLIRFKVYELSEKNEPSVSGWKTGKIVLREGDSLFKIDTCEEDEFDFLSLLAIEIAEECVPSINIVQEDSSINVAEAGQMELKPPSNNKFKEYSIEASVAKQVNYYFSDRNYPKDDYIQAHVKKNPDHYMEIRLLLNFPKIKQIVTDENRLIVILSEFLENNQECNFELDPSSQHIRKKIKNQ